MTENRVPCPEPDCGVAMNTRTEIIAHLEWDHNRRKVKARAMLNGERVQ